MISLLQTLMDTTKTIYRFMDCQLRPLLNVERPLVYTNPHSTLRDYVCAYLELWLRYDFKWFEATLLLRRKAAVN